MAERTLNCLTRRPQSLEHLCFLKFKSCRNYLIQFYLSWEKSFSSIFALWLSDKNWLSRTEWKKVGAKLDQMRLKSKQIVQFECPGHCNHSYCTIFRVIDLSFQHYLYRITFKTDSGLNFFLYSDLNEIWIWILENFFFKSYSKLK